MKSKKGVMTPLRWKFNKDEPRNDVSGIVDYDSQLDLNIHTKGL